MKDRYENIDLTSCTDSRDFNAKRGEQEGIHAHHAVPTPVLARRKPFKFRKFPPAPPPPLFWGDPNWYCERKLSSSVH